TSKLHTLSLHDALPIYGSRSTTIRRRWLGQPSTEWLLACPKVASPVWRGRVALEYLLNRPMHQRLPRAVGAEPISVPPSLDAIRSEEHTSELQSPDHLV